jgi:hypothetical protein
MNEDDADFVLKVWWTVLLWGLCLALWPVGVPVLVVVYGRKLVKAVVPPLWRWLVRRHKEAVARRKLAADAREAERRAERYRLAEEARIKALPKPLTREEKLAAAAARYQALLRSLESAGLDPLELEGAKAQAKQNYLRQLDGEVLR